MFIFQCFKAFPHFLVSPVPRENTFREMQLYNIFNINMFHEQQRTLKSGEMHKKVGEMQIQL